MTTVYLHYDTDDVLLYVGCTDHIDQRTQAHRRSSPWRNEIARIDTEEFTERPDGIHREQVILRTKNPKYNKSLAMCSRYGTERERVLGGIRDAFNYVQDASNSMIHHKYTEHHRWYLDSVRNSDSDIPTVIAAKELLAELEGRT